MQPKYKLMLMETHMAAYIPFKVSMLLSMLPLVYSPMAELFNGKVYFCKGEEVRKWTPKYTALTQLDVILALQPGLIAS